MSLIHELRAIAKRQPDAPCLPGQSWAGFEAAVRDRAAGLDLADLFIEVADADPAGRLCSMLAAPVAGCTAVPVPADATPFERARLLAGLAAPSGATWLFPTSGSLGEPKRVALTDEALRWNARAHAEALGLPEGVRSLVLSPLTHAFPLVAVVLATLLRGGSLAWLPGSFTPRAFMKQVRDEGIGYAAVPPPLLRLLVARNPDAADLPPIMSVGAAPVPAAELASWVAWAARGGCRLYHTYGLTEAGPRVATLAPEDVPAKAHTVGRLLPGVEARVVDGELQLLTPSRMLGYYPELDAAPWLATGDLGHLDADGFLVITGRRKDVIVAGGVTIWAGELEEALEADPRVREAAVVARAHPAYGEVPVGFVVGDLTPEEALAGLTTRLARPKLPHRVVVVQALPRTPLGKVDKQQLREAACEA